MNENTNTSLNQKDSSELSTNSKSGTDGNIMKRDPDQIEYRKHISNLHGTNPPSLLQKYIYFRDFGINMFNALAYSLLEILIREQDRDSLFSFINSYQQVEKDKLADGLNFKKSEKEILIKVSTILKGIINTIDHSKEDQLTLLMRIYYINHEAIAHLFKFFILFEAINNGKYTLLNRGAYNFLDKHEKKPNDNDLKLISELFLLKINKIVNGSGALKYKPQNRKSKAYGISTYQSGTRVYIVYKLSNDQDLEFPSEPMINTYPFIKNPKFLTKNTKKKSVRFRDEDIEWKSREKEKKSVKCPNCNSECMVSSNKFTFNCNKCIKRWCTNHNKVLKECQCICNSCKNPMKVIGILGNTFYCNNCKNINLPEKEEEQSNLNCSHIKCSFIVSNDNESFCIQCKITLFKCELSCQKCSMFLCKTCYFQNYQRRKK